MDKVRIAGLGVVGVIVVGLLAFYTLWLGQPLSFALLLIAVLGLALAFVDTAFGMGFGTLGTPVLLIVGLSSKLAVPSILIAQAASALCGFLLHHRYKNVDLWNVGSHDRKIAVILVGFGFIGTVAAVFVALRVPKMYLNSYIGILIIAMGAIMMLNRKTIFSWWKIVVISLVSGFNKALSGGGYGPVATTGLVVSGHPIKNSVGITLFTVAVINILAFALYLTSKSITSFGLPVFLTIGALMGSQVGPSATKRISSKRAKLAFAAIVIVLGALTIITAIYPVPKLFSMG
ncbi:MAG: sulfite exporter TauE/SafE family protein [Candidatus Micrarchaeota archaeon]|nr:sulfite exporter TauE/SafE family protein [Candidatus Micrarchaeota archaeon]